MKRLLLCSALAALACTTKESPPADTAAPAAAAPQPASLKLADVAGTWNMRAMPLDRDTTLVSYSIMATSDTSGWMLHLPNRPMVPMRVVSAGDSIVAEAGPYQSVLRRNAMTSTRTVYRLQDGRLVGISEVRYSTLPDSVIRLRQEGARTP